MSFVRGRVADVGCVMGGRVARHLQGRGLSCVGIDVSSLALRAARLNGVRSTLNLSIDHFHQRIAEFDTVILFGNNLGIFGNARTRSQDPDEMGRPRRTGDPHPHREHQPVLGGGAPILDRAYCRENLAKGHVLGQCRLRVWYDRSASKWFSWFFASPSDLQALLRGSGWSPPRFVTSASDEPYVAVYEKI